MKYPIPGQVKTRIAKEWGDERAAEIHRELVELTLKNVQSSEWETWCFVTPANSVGPLTHPLYPDIRFYLQQGKDLGERLIHAFEQGFHDGADRVIAIGTDSPWLTTQQIRSAFHQLSETDLVIGPAEDGGYYLIGLSSFVLGLSFSELFKGIEWGTDQVSRQTCDIARRLKLKYVILSKGYDIDTVKDYERFLKNLGPHAERGDQRKFFSAEHSLDKPQGR